MAFLVDNIAPTTLGIEGVIPIGGGVPTQNWYENVTTIIKCNAVLNESGEAIKCL